MPVTMLDVAIVGAGPAGLAAATCARSAAFRRRCTTSKAGPADRSIAASRRVRSRGPRSSATTIGAARRWSRRSCARARATCRRRRCGRSRARADGTFDARASRPDRRRRASTLTVAARAVILATGAQERPFPIPGWTLPGVMMAGARADPAQDRGRRAAGADGARRLRPAAVARRVAIAARGRARSMRCSTRRRAAGCARRSRMRRRSWCRRISRKGRELVRAVRRRVRVIEHVDVAGGAEGDDVASSAVRFRRDGRHERIAAVDQVLLHQGVVPDINLAGAAGCALAWNDLQACFVPVVDAWGGATVPGLFIAGDGAGIAGARGRRSAGPADRACASPMRWAASTAARATAQRTAPCAHCATRNARALAFSMSSIVPPTRFAFPKATRSRAAARKCPAATIVRLARSGCAGPNQMKAFTRCGMGPCQGRWCGLTVTELIARETGPRAGARSDITARAFRSSRSPLGDLAAMPTTPGQGDARTVGHRAPADAMRGAVSRS